MVISLALLLLAAALLCAPGPVGRARLAALWPATPTSARRWRPLTLGPLVLGGLAGLLVVGPGGALAGALVSLVASRRRRGRRAAGIATTTAEQLAESLHRITDELRAGSHPSTALGGVRADGPHARDVLGPAAAARLGDDVPAALRRTAAERPAVAAALERIASAWSLADRHGIPLAELLAGVQADTRWRVRFGNTVRAQLAGPRATAAVLTGLPVLGLVLGQLIGADPIAVLRGGVLGQALLVVGVGLAAAGSAWSEQILRSAVPR
jgi:tight adherence protein B